MTHQNRVYARGMNTKKNIAVVPNAIAVKAVFDPQEPTKNILNLGLDRSVPSL